MPSNTYFIMREWLYGGGRTTRMGPLVCHHPGREIMFVPLNS